jgi:hypothetical protein
MVKSNNNWVELGKKNPQFLLLNSGKIEKFGQVVRYYCFNICSSNFGPGIGRI